jgi:hypothetical protein
MPGAPAEKHFLDTSVARPFILGSAKYKKYLRDTLGDDPLYASDYVQMEFTRSMLRALVDFYFVLDMPSIETIEDACACWSDKFRTSELKAVVQLMGKLASMYRLGMSDPGDKEKALRAIARIVERITIEWRSEFKNPGVNSTRCKRASVQLRFGSKANDKELFREFLKTFNDVKAHRKRCDVVKFFVARYKTNVEKYVQHASKLAKPKSPENIGFTKIAEKLRDILEEGKDLSCHSCQSVGDAIIALEAPLTMRLEHTDHSFDHLCEVIGSRHFKHLSQVSVVKSNSKTARTGAKPPADC